MNEIGFDQEGVMPTLPARGGLAIPVDTPLAGGGGQPPPPPPPQPPQTQQQVFEQSGARVQAAPPPNPEPQSVPYDRFAEQVHARRQLEARLGAAEETINRIRSSMGGEGGEDGGDGSQSAAQRQAEFYSDPQGYVDRRLTEVSQQTRMAYPMAREVIDYEMTKQELRRQHGANSEVENQVVEAIRQYGLRGVQDETGAASRGQAIRLAYKLVTGKEIGSSQAQVKAQIQPPSSGGGSGTEQASGDLQSLYRMSPADVEKVGPQQWVNQVMAAVKSQPT